jgi:outer membrane protein OmpA-like peptidoglycan-associated protein
MNREKIIAMILTTGKRRVTFAISKLACVLALFYMNIFGISEEERPEIISTNKNGHSGLISVYDGKSLGPMHLSVTLNSELASDKKLIKRMVYYDRSSQRQDTAYPLINLMQFKPAIGFGVTDFLDFALSIPFYADLAEGFSPEGAFGDLKFSTQFRIPGKKDRLTDAALLAGVSFPTGEKSKGYVPRHTLYYQMDSDSVISCFSSGSYDFDIEAIWRLNTSWFGTYVNAGCLFTSKKTLSDLLILRTALELKLTSNISFFTELISESRFSNVADGFRINRDPFWLEPGFQVVTEHGGLVALTGGICLTSKNNITYNSHSGSNLTPGNDREISGKVMPSWRAGLHVGWNMSLRNVDRDRDLVSDEYDKCPKQKEDLDNFDDHDGCPDTDNDKDGIIDSLDKCPDSPEDFDKTEDNDGCPDLDNDLDRIVDSLDKCPEVPEDFDGFEDDDGCPDPDNDSDGISDTLDKCISELEDNDGFEDTDGCPDIDNDLDGIADNLDQCPDSSGLKEDNGCPKVREKAKEIKMGRVILAGVAFEPKTAKIVESAYRILDQVYLSLIDYPGVKVEVWSHTDSTGSVSQNFSLTQRRADTVRDYLISKGVDPFRLKAIGKGSQDPIADNSAIPGRQLNNRIELYRTE